MSSVKVTTNSDGVELEEVDSNYIQVEMATTEMLLLEPLKDHNYISSFSQSDTIKRPHKKRNQKKIRTNPKITSITLLYNCKICGYATTKRDVFTKHQEIHGRITPGTKYVPCNSCNINKDVPKGYHQCPHCSYYAKTMSSLRVHMHIHNRSTAYKCTECPFYGRNLKDLITHLKTSRSHVCGSCSFSSHIQDRVLKHQKKHAVKTFSLDG